MKTKFIALTTAVAFAFSGCSWLQSHPAVEADIQKALSALEQFAISAATQYFAGTLVLGGHKLSASRYGVVSAEEKVIEAAEKQFPNLSDNQIRPVVVRKFTEQAAIAPIPKTSP